MVAQFLNLLATAILLLAGPSSSTPIPRPQLYATPDNEPEPAVVSKRSGDLAAEGTIGLNVFASPLGSTYSGIGSVNPYSLGAGSIGTAYGVNQLNSAGGGGLGGYYGAAAGLGGLGGGYPGGLGGLGGGYPGGLGGLGGGYPGGLGSLGGGYPGGLGGLGGGYPLGGGLGGLGGGYPLGGGLGGGYPLGGGLGGLGGGYPLGGGLGGYSPYGMYGYGNGLGIGIAQGGLPFGGGVVGPRPGFGASGLSVVPASPPLPTSSSFFNQRFPSPLDITTRRVFDSVGQYLQSRIPRLVDRLVFDEDEDED